jgi:hypothetical protein
VAGGKSKKAGGKSKKAGGKSKKAGGKSKKAGGRSEQIMAALSTNTVACFVVKAYCVIAGWQGNN